jgi:hypothetical protein
MNQYQQQYSVWPQSVPLPPPATNKERKGIVPSPHSPEADPAAAIPLAGQSPELPLVAQDDDFQWLILL